MKYVDHHNLDGKGQGKAGNRWSSKGSNWKEEEEKKQKKGKKKRIMITMMKKIRKKKKK